MATAPEQTAELRSCEGCGLVAGAKDRFCRKCGRQLPLPELAGEARPNGHVTQEPPPPPTLPWVIVPRPDDRSAPAPLVAGIVAAIVVAFAGAAIAIVLAVSNAGATPTVTSTSPGTATTVTVISHG